MIVRNERYRGVVHWNTSEWRKDPNTGNRKRVMRARSEWVSTVAESLRIVPDDLWERAQRRHSTGKKQQASAVWRQTLALSQWAGVLELHTRSSRPGRKRTDRPDPQRTALAIERAAEAYRRQIAFGLEGEPHATLKH
jgi:hypothetical protein